MQTNILNDHHHQTPTLTTEQLYVASNTTGMAPRHKWHCWTSKRLCLHTGALEAIAGIWRQSLGWAGIVRPWLAADA